jgi:hypothetical protein
MVIYCGQCGDPFDPVEYVTPNIDEVNFCSSICAEDYENQLTYVTARFGGATAV